MSLLSGYPQIFKHMIDSVDSLGDFSISVANMFRLPSTLKIRIAGSLQRTELMLYIRMRSRVISVRTLSWSPFGFSLFFKKITFVSLLWKLFAPPSYQQQKPSTCPDILLEHYPFTIFSCTSIPLTSSSGKRTRLLSHHKLKRCT